MSLLLLVGVALADPLPIVAIGEGVVAGAPAAEGAQVVPGGWITVLADCLEERAPQRFSVVDRAAPGETVVEAESRIAGIRELSPAWVILALGARELGGERVDPKKLGQKISALVDDLRRKAAGVEARPPNVLLVGLVPPTLSQGPGPAGEPAEGASRQAALDALAAGWNKVLASIAAPGQGIVHLDPWSDWPREGEPRAALTVGGWSLSAQGQAKIAASVCDAVLALP